MRWFAPGLALLAATFGLVPVQAQESSKSPVITGLFNPTGVAVQPETGHLFVCDSGALRVLRIDPATPDKAHSAIKGFSKDIYGKGPMVDIGPLGLVFLDKDTLVVGDGGKPDAEETVKIFAVPAPGKSIQADDAKFTLGPIGPGEESLKGEGNFYALAASKSAIYVTCNGDDTKGWVSKIELNGSTPGKLTPFIATKLATNVDAPVGITLDAEGRIVVGQMGEINVPADSLLTIYNPKDGKMIANGETGLYDIAGLAYSPKSGKLYAVDYGWMDNSKGGLFRLDVTQDGNKLTVKTSLIAQLDKPTALAFAPDGTLYVTVIGTATEEQKRPGALLKFTGDL